MNNRDYSKMKQDAYDKYRAVRSNRFNVRFDFYSNDIGYNPEDRTFSVFVDETKDNEYLQKVIEKFERERAAKDGFEYESDSELDIESLDETLEQFHSLQSRYRIRRGFSPVQGEEPSTPLVNALSGRRIDCMYGEGILDFIYADFKTPIKNMAEMFSGINALSKKDSSNSDLSATKIIENEEQLVVDEFERFRDAFIWLKDICYASLYSAVCPPLFEDSNDLDLDKLLWYGNYLLELQKEYREMIEFCYDEDFHPEILGKLYPSERYNLYLMSKEYPTAIERKERVMFSISARRGNQMPFGMPADEWAERMAKVNLKPTVEATAFAKEFNLSVNSLMFRLQHPTFMSVWYKVQTVEEMLELEFTKMLEQNIRFRKCKRCGRYFIMKGNYETRYCDRVAPGETRNCQELAAIENYKSKTADDKALKIYSKYYKRYAARLKVRQIKEADFKKWKYKAMDMRDRCSDGDISTDEYVEWMESAFPNRKPKS